MNEWIICSGCWLSYKGAVGTACVECGKLCVATPLFKSSAIPVQQLGFDWSEAMKCPECQTKLSTKNYDAEFEWYECPKCEGAFTADEIEEAASGTSLAARKRNGNSASGKNSTDARVRSDLQDAAVRSSSRPTAKGKKRRTEIAEDAEAIAEHEATALKVQPREKEAKHRDEVSFGQVVNIMADEIEVIAEETGTKVDRLNAREFYGVNLWRSLITQHGVSAREKAVPMVKCAEHG